MSKKITASILVIGNEILSGRTQDANIHYLAYELSAKGINVDEVRVIPDVEQEIIEAVNHCRQKFDYVFTTGGIGATHDDITAASIAKAFDVPFELHSKANRILLDHYGDKANAARMRMAMMPRGAELIDNPVSKAPGFKMDNVYVFAGVPLIARAMFEGVKNNLLGGAVTLSRTVSSLDVSEGVIGENLRLVQDQHPDVDIGSYPFLKFGGFGVNLVVRGVNQALIDAVCEDICAMIKQAGGTVIDGETQGEELK